MFRGIGCSFAPAAKATLPSSAPRPAPPTSGSGNQAAVRSESYRKTHKLAQVT